MDGWMGRRHSTSHSKVYKVNLYLGSLLCGSATGCEIGERSIHISASADGVKEPRRLGFLDLEFHRRYEYFWCRFFCLRDELIGPMQASSSAGLPPSSLSVPKLALLASFRGRRRHRPGCLVFGAETPTCAFSFPRRDNNGWSQPHRFCAAPRSFFGTVFGVACQETPAKR
ncbi:hypothetical protein VFPPC_15311 [Pochonia chlamydosporia 170]|uniref:Uncharacterized protein n=1 Tax=Pochonia chlamydosporia 170 TaxID=1380566 RepID=A0A179G6R1_METCM|nr:hypothetical protein VFPPC_15311 [Pochonia chlamydosporia 170]OAQ73477.1 hypothetical protein VFPPC_15311 [Pochonia chlamydosporia 170]